MDIAAHFPVLVIVIPLITALIIPLAGRINRSYAWYIALAVTFYASSCQPRFLTL